MSSDQRKPGGGGPSAHLVLTGHLVLTTHLVLTAHLFLTALLVLTRRPLSWF